MASIKRAGRDESRPAPSVTRSLELLGRAAVLRAGLQGAIDHPLKGGVDKRLDVRRDQASAAVLGRDTDALVGGVERSDSRLLSAVSDRDDRLLDRAGELLL